MFKVGIDSVNKTAQFKLKDSVSAVTLFFEGKAEDGLNSDNNVTFESLGKDMSVSIELIRKNQPNVTLLDLTAGELYKITDILFKGAVKNTIPLTVGANLILNDEAYLLVTLEWKNSEITKLEVFENKMLGDSGTPLTIKTVEIDEQTEVNTEFYTAVVFDRAVKSLETVKTEVDDEGNVVSQKQEMTYDFMAMLSDEVKGVVFPTEKEQKVKFYGEGKVYLVQI